MKEKQTKQMKGLFSSIRKHLPLAGLVAAATTPILGGCNSKPLSGAIANPFVVTGDVANVSSEQAKPIEKVEKNDKNEAKPVQTRGDSVSIDSKAETEKNKKTQK